MRAWSILIISLLTIASQSVAQSTQSSPKVKVVPMQEDYTRTKDGTVISGSPYLFDEFAIGELWMNGTVFNAEAMRYNIYRDVMEYFEKDMQLEILPEPSIQRVEVRGKVFVVEMLNEKPGFFLILDSGKAKLLCKMTVAFSKGVERQGMHEAQGPSYSRQKDKYFFQLADGKLMRLENIDDFVESIPDHREEVANYAKSKKLSAKKEEHVMLLLNYYNSLGL